jgi:hypothetical protein
MLENTPKDATFEEEMTTLASNADYCAGLAGSHDVPDSYLYRAAEMVKLIPQLFDKIKHGEPGHEAWLKEAIECHFLGKPMPDYVAK